MKVKVLQVENVKFKWWQWWSDWVDVAVFNYSYGGYLLQMKVSRGNSKRFRAIAFKAPYNFAHPSTVEVGDLVQINTE